MQKLGKTRKPGAEFSSAILSTCLAWMALLVAIVPAYGDDQIANSPAEQLSVSTDELLRQIQQLRQELEQLRNNQRPPLWFSPDADLRGFSSPASPPPQSDGSVLSSSSESGNADGIMREDVADPAAGLPGGEGPAIPGIGDNFPMRLSYRYNAGGGYTSLSTPDGKYSVNLQNLVVG